MLTILTLLFLKHFLVDFPLQPKYMYSNKGTYGHPGGILHSGFHGLVTFYIFSFYTPYAIAFGIVDFVVHYHIDWAKMNINKKMGWGPTTHEEFWWLTGLDQFLHALTYIGLVAFL